MYLVGICTLSSERASKRARGVQQHVIPLWLRVLVLVLQYKNDQDHCACVRARREHSPYLERTQPFCKKGGKLLGDCWNRPVLKPRNNVVAMSMLVGAVVLSVVGADPSAVHHHGESAAPPPSPSVPGTWERVLLTEAVSNGGAVCLDGSPGAFYIRTHNPNGVKADPSRWVIFMEGGGWCASDTNCADRALTDLGSSKNYPPLPTAIEPGALFLTPPFDTFTAVYAKYCDGGSWTGAASTAPVRVGNQTIYYRGRALLDALFEELFARGLSSASQLLWSGCSAGGLTTYVHADWVTSLMHERAPAAKVVALADAMFSLNHLRMDGANNWPMMMHWVYTAMNSTDSVNQACVADMAAKFGVPKGNRSEGWRCMFGSAVAPYVQTPLFVLNSKYDTWQMLQIIGLSRTDCLNCTGTPRRCAVSVMSCTPAQRAFWVDYGHQMVDLLTALPPRHTAFVRNCPAHCQAGQAGFLNDTINGVSMTDAITTWYGEAIKGTQASLPRYIERCDAVMCGSDTCGGVVRLD